MTLGLHLHYTGWDSGVASSLLSIDWSVKTRLDMNSSEPFHRDQRFLSVWTTNCRRILNLEHPEMLASDWPIDFWCLIIIIRWGVDLHRTNFAWKPLQFLNRKNSSIWWNAPLSWLNKTISYILRDTFFTKKTCQPEDEGIFIFVGQIITIAMIVFCVYIFLLCKHIFFVTQNALY